MRRNRQQQQAVGKSRQRVFLAGFRAGGGGGEGGGGGGEGGGSQGGKAAVFGSLRLSGQCLLGGENMLSVTKSIHCFLALCTMDCRM